MFLATWLVALSGCSGLLKLDGLTFDLVPDDAGSGDGGDEPAPPRTDVGVLPVFGNGLHATCPGRPEAYLEFFMDDQDGAEQPACSDESTWVLPPVAKGPVTCSATDKNTTLRFCRVSGADFKNLASDVSDAPNHYAVLMLGNACPDGAVALTRKIDNEDRANDNRAEGDIAPNKSNPNETQLSFCFFRGGPSTMTSFPDLGMDYAVFHDFDGDQPSWVLRKKWIHSDDEDSEQNSNGYFPMSAPGVPDFMRIVEMPIGASGRPDTTFDLAQVR